MSSGPKRRTAALVIAIATAAACSSGDAPAPVATDPCVEPATGLPTDVFCTGLYVGRNPAIHAESALPYKPGATLWSDGAEKRRFLYLPPDTTIDSSDLDAWKFPVGTKAWKEFRVEGKLVETRIFWKRSATQWDAGTYVWDEGGTSAILNVAPKGIVLSNGYEIPTLKDCDKCHHGGSDKLLGIEAVALALPRAEGLTLTALVQRGALSHPPHDTAATLPEDATGKAGEAVGVLHANCGMPCHSGRGLGDETRLRLRLRAGELWPDGTTLSPVALADTEIYRATVSQPPSTASVAQGFPGALRLTPGAHEQSLVWLLSHLRGSYQMPPLVSHRIDEAGTQTVADWIDALPPP